MVMTHEEFIEKLLIIEEDTKILDFKINDIPLWLIIRNQLFLDMKIEFLGIENPHISVKPRQLKIQDRVRYIYYVLSKLPLKNNQVDILIISNMVNSISNGNGIFFNKLYFQIPQIHRKTLLMERSYKFKFFFPRKENVLCLDIIDIVPYILRKVVTLSKKEISEVENFIHFLGERLATFENILNKSIKQKSNLIQKYKVSILKYIKSQKIKKQLYKYILSNYKPKLIILDCAHYFDDIMLTMLAKKEGILIAEYQHGFIGKQHSSYNFHNNLIKHIKEYLPDYFLTWGKYWSKSVNTPSQKFEIGNFFLNFLNQDAGKPQEIKENRNKGKLVLISGGKFPNEYNILSKSLKEHFSEYILVFRPHPSERPKLQNRYKNLIDLGFIMDNNNLYLETLPNADIVISLEVSTVLYEALFYTSNVFLFDITNSVVGDNLPFHVVKSIKEIKKLLSKRKPKINSYIWENDPVTKFKQFLNLVGLCDDNNN